MQVGDDVEVKDTLETRTRGGIGDTDLLLKICLPMPTKYVSVGFLGEASFPTGRKEAGFTTGKTDFGAKGLLTLNLVDMKNFVPTRLHLNLGYRFNRNEDAGYGIFYANNPDSSGFYPPAYPRSPEGKGTNFNDVLQFGAGLEFLAKESSLFVEFTWDDYLNADFLPADTATYYLAGNKNIYTITPGVKLVSSTGVAMTLAADFSLNSESKRAFVRPSDWAVYFMLSMGGNVLRRTRTRTESKTRSTPAPTIRRISTASRTRTVAPIPTTTKTGSWTRPTSAPIWPRTSTGSRTRTAARTSTTTATALPTARTRARTSPRTSTATGTRTAARMTSGRRQDGIADEDDNCPPKAEDFDGFEDEDGCPEPDNDLDGIPDSTDRCPNESETYNGYLDEDGCPDERPHRGEVHPPGRQLRERLGGAHARFILDSGSGREIAQGVSRSEDRDRRLHGRRRQRRI